LDFLSKNEGIKFTPKHLGETLELNSRSVNVELWRASKLNIGIYRATRGVWVYSPDKPVEYERSPETVLAKLLDFLSKSEGAKFTVKHLGETLALNSKRVNAELWRASKLNIGIYRAARGVWVYSPNEPVEFEDPPHRKLLDLLEDGPKTSNEIAKALGIPQREVRALVITMRKTFYVKTSREITYKLEVGSE
jgi:frataxin-like iron-binding protein CyaY